MTKKPKVQQDPEDIIEVPVLARSILEIQTAMRKALAAGLNRKAIIVLVAYHSKVPMRDVEIVLNNLEDLAKTWLRT